MKKTSRVRGIAFIGLLAFSAGIFSALAAG